MLGNDRYNFLYWKNGEDFQRPDCDRCLAVLVAGPGTYMWHYSLFKVVCCSQGFLEYCWTKNLLLMDQGKGWSESFRNWWLFPEDYRYSSLLKIHVEKFYLSLDGIWRVGGYIWCRTWCLIIIFSIWKWFRILEQLPSYSAHWRESRYQNRETDKEPLGWKPPGTSKAVVDISNQTTSSSFSLLTAP